MQHGAAPPQSQFSGGISPEQAAKMEADAADFNVQQMAMAMYVKVITPRISAGFEDTIADLRGMWEQCREAAKVPFEEVEHDVPQGS